MFTFTMEIFKIDTQVEKNVIMNSKQDFQFPV